MRYNNLRVFWDADFVPCLFFDEVKQNFPDLYPYINDLCWDIQIDGKEEIVLALLDVQELIEEKYVN